MRVYEVICPACGKAWQTTLGPLYEPVCWNAKARIGCRAALPSRERVIKDAGED